MKDKLLLLMGYAVDPAIAFNAPPEDHREMFVRNVLHGQKQTTLARNAGICRQTAVARIAAVRRWLLED